MELREELVIPPDATETQFQFSVLDDEVVEGVETVQLVLVVGEGETGVQFADGGVVNGVILDDNDSK